MRWLTIPPGDKIGQAKKQQKLNDIQQFWQGFQSQSESLPHPSQSNINQMDSLCSRIDDRIIWDITKNPTTKANQLTLTPEHESHLRPLLATVIEQAPTIPNWEFLTYRPPAPSHDLNQLVEERLGHEITAKGVDLKVERGRINLKFHFAGLSSGNPQFEESFALTELILGEENMDVFVGAIDAETTIMPSPTTPLDQFAIQFQTKLQELQLATPPQPHHALTYHQRPYALVDVHAQAEINPFSDVSLDDLMILNGHPLFIENRLTFTTFHSQPLTRFNEIFFYLQIDRSENWISHDPEARQQLELALDNVIAPQGLGAVVGSGHGAKFSNIHFATTQLWPCIDALRATVQAQGINPRSWFLFHDCTLAAEWIPTTQNTPPPNGLPT